MARKPKENSEDLAARLKQDSIPGNLYVHLEEALARKDAKDAEFYSADPDELMEVFPEAAEVMDGNLQDDSRILKDFFKDTIQEAAREPAYDGGYSSQLEVMGKHKPRDVSHH